MNGFRVQRYMTPVKIRNIIIVLIVVLIAGCILVGFFLPVSHTSFITRTEKIIRKKAGLDSCHAEKVTIVPFRGITITDLVCRKKLNARELLTISISSVKIPYRFLKIVSQRKTIKSLLVPAPKCKGRKKIKWQTKTLFSTLYSRVISSDTLLLSIVKSIACKKIKVTIDSLNVNTTLIDEGYGTISVLGSSPPKLKVKLGSKTLHSKAMQIEEPEINVLINGPHFTVKKAGGTIFDTKYKASCEIICMQDKIVNGLFELSNFDLAQWYATLGDTLGSLTGNGTFLLMFDTTDLEFTDFQGRGHIKMTEVVVEEIPLVTIIALLTELKGLNHLTFEELSGDFVVKEGKIYSDNIKGAGDPLSIDITGWIRPEDVYYDFDLKGIFEAYYKDSISAIVWNAMLPEEDGRRLFKCSVYGTPASPSVSLDKKIARRAVRSVFKSLGQEIKGMFKKRK